MHNEICVRLPTDECRVVQNVILRTPWAAASVDNPDTIFRIFAAMKITAEVQQESGELKYMNLVTHIGKQQKAISLWNASSPVTFSGYIMSRYGNLFLQPLKRLNIVNTSLLSVFFYANER